MTQESKVAVFSKGIASNTNLKIFLEIDKVQFKPTENIQIEYVVGWGRKANTKQARVYAVNNKLDYYSLEDGFLHSMGQGVLGDACCSLVVDKKGIYYDATQESDLEELINDSFNELSHNKNIVRAQKSIKRITQNNITKYNNGSLSLENLAIESEHTVLIIDQTAGDMSLKYGLADDLTFKRMVDDAVRENPNSQIIIKTHPDVVVGKKKGCIDFKTIDVNIKIISSNINPIVLLKQVDKVYVATSQMGFEALMLNKHVICYGVPFYALWGLTEDRSDRELSVRTRRTNKRSLEEIFIAAYFSYTRYLHPDSNKKCELESILDYFEFQYKHQSRFNTQRAFCINFTRWKQNHIQSFLIASSGNHQPVQFISNVAQAEKKGFDSQSQLITWASKNQNEVLEIAKKWGGVPWYMEDGFIRSTGLGTDLTAPASIVLDKTGIYYDPNNPSDLETNLQNKEFTDLELNRAESLKNILIENQLSKYNLGVSFSKDSLVSDLIIILIPGQVEADASIQKGCVDIRTNTTLIKAVREKNQDAFLIYKPHPDVVSGNRGGKVEKSVTDLHCDLVLANESITDCLALADEVHTMTSLVGFEALLRDLKVVCYGIPFYSGWGLTQDFHKVERRTRKLKINELVHATLIDYPLYMNWKTSMLTTPEVIVEQLRAQIEKQGGKQSNQVFWLTRLLRKIKNYIKGVFFFN